MQRRSTGKPDCELPGLYASLSATLFLTLVAFYGLGENLGTTVVARSATGADLSVLMAAPNLAILAWWLYRWIRPLPVFARVRREAPLPVGAFARAESDSLPT